MRDTQWTQENETSGLAGEKQGVRLFRAFSTKALPVLLGLSILMIAFAPSLWAVDRAKIDELQDRRQSIQSRVRELKQKRQEKYRQAAIHNVSLIRNQRELERKKRSRVSHVKNLENTKNRIDYLDHKIDRTTGEAARLGEDAGKRLKSMYMGERLSMLQMVLDAKDMSTLLDRLYYKKKLIAQDKKLLTELKGKIYELNGLKGELAQQKVVLDRTIQVIRVQEMEIARSAEAERQLRDKYLKDAQFYAMAERQMLSESNSIASEIRRLSASNKLNLDKKVATGSMMWPLRAPIRSGFGRRYHPIHRRSSMHTGLDIGGPNRAAIHAADGGRVIFAGWKGGYGKCVMINHGFKGGDNIVTLYGHLSSFSVGVGQYVSKGQVIAAEGSTGYSTGPHLHFEVRRNGSPVNPYGYLP